MSVEVNQAAADAWFKRSLAAAEARGRGDIPIEELHKLQRILLYKSLKQWRVVDEDKAANLTDMRGNRWFVPEDKMRWLYEERLPQLSQQKIPNALVEQTYPFSRPYVDFDGKKGAELESSVNIARVIAETWSPLFDQEQLELQIYFSPSSVMPKHNQHYCVPRLVCTKEVRAGLTWYLRDKLIEANLPLAAAALDLNCKVGLRQRGAMKFKYKVKLDENGKVDVDADGRQIIEGVWEEDKGTYPDWVRAYPPTENGRVDKPNPFYCCMVVWNRELITPLSALGKQVVADSAKAAYKAQSSRADQTPLTITEQEELRALTSEFLKQPQWKSVYSVKHIKGRAMHLTRNHPSQCPCELKELEQRGFPLDNAVEHHDSRGAVIELTEDGRRVIFRCWCSRHNSIVLRGPEWNAPYWGVDGAEPDFQFDDDSDDEDGDEVEEDEVEVNNKNVEPTPSTMSSKSRKKKEPTVADLENRAARAAFEARQLKKRAKELKQGVVSTPSEVKPQRSVDKNADMSLTHHKVPFTMQPMKYNVAVELFDKYQGQGLAEAFVRRTEHAIKRDSIGGWYYVLDEKVQLWKKKTQLDVSHYILPALDGLADQMTDLQMRKDYRKKVDSGSVNSLDKHIQAEFNRRDEPIELGEGAERRLARFCEHLDLKRDLIPTRDCTVVEVRTVSERPRKASDMFTKEMPVRVINKPRADLTKALKFLYSLARPLTVRVAEKGTTPEQLVELQKTWELEDFEKPECIEKEATLEEMIGVALTGYISGKKIYVLVGATNGGKSLLLDILQWIAGDFSCELSTAVLLDTGKPEEPNAATGGLAPLCGGRRVCVMGEAKRKTHKHEAPPAVATHILNRFVGNKNLLIRPPFYPTMQAVPNLFTFIVALNNMWMEGLTEYDVMIVRKKEIVIHFEQEFAEDESFKDQLFGDQQFMDEVFTVGMYAAQKFLQNNGKLLHLGVSGAGNKFSGDVVARFVADCVLLDQETVEPGTKGLQPASNKDIVALWKLWRDVCDVANLTDMQLRLGLAKYLPRVHKNKRCSGFHPGVVIREGLTAKFEGELRDRRDEEPPAKEGEPTKPLKEGDIVEDDKKD